MKKILALVTVAVAVSALSGCSSIQWRKKKAPKPAPAVAAAQPAAPAASSAQRPAIRVGVSSVTVEQMAKEQGCTGGPGAALVGEPGPVEVYRMQCADGRVFSARCELRQCKKI